MRYERAFAIPDRHDRLIELIRAGGYSTPALAERLGVSDQTIYRDIEHLKKSGYTIRSQKHSSVWAYHLLAEPTPAPESQGAARV